MPEEEKINNDECFDFTNFDVLNDVDLNRCLDFDYDILLKEAELQTNGNIKPSDFYNGMVKFVKEKLNNYNRHEIATYITLLFGTTRNKDIKKMFIQHRALSVLIEITKVINKEAKR